MSCGILVERTQKLVIVVELELMLVVVIELLLVLVIQIVLQLVVVQFGLFVVQLSLFVVLLWLFVVRISPFVVLYVFICSSIGSVCSSTCGFIISFISSSMCNFI